MFANAVFIALVSSALGAVASGSTTIKQCNTGDVQCCNQVTTAKDEGTAALLGLLGIVVKDINAAVGLGCTPVTVGLGGVSCTQQPVCCTGNNFNGLVNIGCSPIAV